MKISYKTLKEKIKNKFMLRKKAKAKVKALPKSKVKVPVKTKAQVKTKKVSYRPKKITTKPKVASRKRATTAAVFGPLNVRPYHPKKNEEYMNKKQLTHFQAILLQWKEQLMADVDRTMHYLQNEAANYPDPVDRASQEEEFSLELRTRDRERKLLKKIEETLNRINDGDYGYCDDCGAEIGIRRLEARPTATQCVECKTIAEIKEKQIGEGF